MRRKILTYILPEYLACYLINNDDSSLFAAELTEINNFLKRERISITGVSDEGFFKHSNDLNNIGVTCLEYYAFRIPYNRTIDKIITKVDTSRGAPMGRPNVGTRPVTVTRGNNGRICKCDQKRIFDCRVPLPIDGAYDKGGAYWGIGAELRVAYTKDLTYIEFYRNGEQNW